MQAFSEDFVIEAAVTEEGKQSVILRPGPDKGKIVT